jgi:hypothetical protein
MFGWWRWSDLTVVQGEPRVVELHLPTGYQLTGITGSSLETRRAGRWPPRADACRSSGTPASVSCHAERPHPDGSFTFDTGFVAISDVQRERGEVAV